MKKLIALSSIALFAVFLCSGCIGIGNRSDLRGGDTLGKQLLDLKTAQTMGAITDAEYQTLKAKLLGTK
ncbi:MAG: hypothetical protein JWM68_5406 [Verrucomicrobiales bacterium]|nr:hypothetical protein [Verrucomicrobiales bacterium]